jgi:hypothetical protein
MELGWWDYDLAPSEHARIHREPSRAGSDHRKEHRQAKDQCRLRIEDVRITGWEKGKNCANNADADDRSRKRRQKPDQQKTARNESRQTE